MIAQHDTHYDQDKDTDLDDVDVVDDCGYRVGDIVTVTHLDTSTQLDVVQYGTVVDVADDPDSGPAVRVAWFPEVTDPIPLNHELHERVDAPRVQLVG